MNKRGSADKIKLSSFDDLFGTQEAGTGTEQVQEIPLCELHEFRGHRLRWWMMRKCRKQWRALRTMVC